MGCDLCCRCGAEEPHGMDCGCPTEPCFMLNPKSKPAPELRCPHCGDTGHTDHDADVPCAVCKPAPAPLPPDLICAEVFFSDVDQIGGYSIYAIKGMADKLFAHITAQAARLAEVEAELSAVYARNKQFMRGLDPSEEDCEAAGDSEVPS